jgi:hypothetical protein
MAQRVRRRFWRRGEERPDLYRSGGPRWTGRSPKSSQGASEASVQSWCGRYWLRMCRCVECCRGVPAKMHPASADWIHVEIGHPGAVRTTLWRPKRRAGVMPCSRDSCAAGGSRDTRRAESDRHSPAGRKALDGGFACRIWTYRSSRAEMLPRRSKSGGVPCQSTPSLS